MHDMENEPLDNRVPIIERHKEIDLIQSCINRMAQNSFQVKGWTVALFAVILALLPEKVESMMNAVTFLQPQMPTVIPPAIPMMPPGA